MSNDLLSNMSGYICSSCGAEAKEGNKFCVRCGSPVQKSGTETAAVSESPVSSVDTAPPAPVVQQQVTAQPVMDDDFIPTNKSKYQPISTKGYIGIWLLMMIPAVNLLLLIVWACGGCRKINKRNYARSMLIIGAIFLVLGGVLALVFRNALSGLIPFASPFGSY